MRTPLVLLSIALIAAFSLATLGAHAAASAKLVYGRAPDVDGCGDEAAVRQAVALRVGYDPFVLVSSNSIAVTISRAGADLVADVRLVDKHGVFVGGRTLHERTGRCEELTAAIALAIGIALDMVDSQAAAVEPDPTPETPPPSSPPAPAPPEAAPARPVEPDAAPVIRPPRPSPPVTFGAGWSAAINLAPAVATGPAVFAALRAGSWSFGVEGHAYLPASAPVGLASLPADATVRTSLFVGGPSVCWNLAPYFACAVVLAGSATAQAPGVADAAPSVHASFLVTGGRAGLEFPMPLGLSLRAMLDVFANPLGLTVRTGVVDVWHAPPVGGSGEIDLALSIP